MANTEKIIIYTQQVSFYKRFILKECLPLLLIFTIFLLVPGNFIVKFLFWIGISFLASLPAIGHYNRYIYKISISNDIILIDFLFYNKKERIEFNLNTINIDLTKGIHARTTFKIIAFRKTYDLLFRIEPELRFAKFWTEEKIEDVYKLLKEAQDEVKQGSE